MKTGKGWTEYQKAIQCVLDALPMGICLFDDSGTITYTNPVYRAIFQQKDKESIGKNVREFASDLGAWDNKKSETEKYISYMVDGISVMANCSPLHVDGREAGGIITIHNDKALHALHEELRSMAAKANYLEQQLLQRKKTCWNSEQMKSESEEQKWMRIIKSGKAFEKFIGMSTVTLDVLVMAGKAAKVQSTVLLSGKSGTGKELVAEGIHQASPRAQGPFIKINCAAIPANLLESELFGHEKGAFTGALQRKLGKFELAHKGTIFLDEIGEMDLGMQSKLLRVLQSSQFERVGGVSTIQVDVRIVAATNQNLEKMVKEGRFREDLFYRLNVIPICLPPLKERDEDIPLLIDFFLKKFKQEFSKEILGITKAAMEVLIKYEWPGNVRELKNIIERMVALKDSGYLEVADIPSCCFRRETANEAEGMAKVNGSIIQGEIFPLEEYEKQIIRAALDKYGSYSAAGKVLGITHNTVAAKAQKYGINRMN